MTKELVIFHCSPTMAGMKTGSLFTCPIEERNVLTENIRQLNSSLVPGGIRLLPVKYMGCRALIYMYRPEKLAEDLKDKAAKMKFAQYRECTRAYCEAFRRGDTFDRLIVGCS